MLEHAFEVWGCRRVELKTDALNERSRGAMEALGATFEGIHRKHMLVRDGENRDSAWYAILDDEWPAVASARPLARARARAAPGQPADERTALCTSRQPGIREELEHQMIERVNVIGARGRVGAR